MVNETYSLRVVTTYLNSKGISFEHWSGYVGYRYSFYEHGCRITLNCDLKMSIQTHPIFAGPAFAETVIQSLETKSFVYDKFGYADDVLRFQTPEKLFEHIENVMRQIKELDAENTI